ncbi:MAG: VanZ family protein [Verrucomicrobiota bacterium]
METFPRNDLSTLPIEFNEARRTGTMSSEDKDKNGRRRWLGFLWPLALMAAISFASGGNPVALPNSFFTSDKLAHLLVFGLLATACYRAFSPEWSKARRTIFAITFTALFGLADELHQSTTPGRYMEFDDWIADVLGAVIAVYVYRIWGTYRRVLEFRPARRKSPSTINDLAAGTEPG